VAGSAVRRIIVDNQYFPVATGETLVEPLYKRLDIIMLVEGRNDDRDIGNGFAP
jgi:hypothetical protein